MKVSSPLLFMVAYAAAALAGARTSCLCSALAVVGAILARPRKACINAHTPGQVLREPMDKSDSVLAIGAPGVDSLVPL